MRIFTTTTNRNKEKSKKTGRRGMIFLVIPFWLLVWQLLAVFVDSKILLASPADVMKELIRMLFTVELYKSIIFTLSRVCLGFITALILGVLFGALSYKFVFLHMLFNPLIALIKAAPVASFIILVLIWVPSKNISIIISFLMGFPIIYTNIFEGLSSMENELKEVATVFRLSLLKKLRFIYIPAVIPFFRAACALSLGMCFKAAVAAEIIGLADGSIGDKLYKAKIYLETPSLFAWTVIIIVISVLFTKLVLKLIDLCLDRLEGRR